MSVRYTVLTGGVGGAKLVDGLYRILPPHSLTAIVNTGDDFRHFGLPISPDIDTLLYTLSGKSNQTLGWGREDETWNFMAVLRSLGGEDWFNLGDGDLALHVLRGAALAAGEPLSAIIACFAQAPFHSSDERRSGGNMGGERRRDAPVPALFCRMPMCAQGAGGAV